MRFALALATLCVAAGPASAQDGGKIPWANRKKTDEAETKAVVEDAKRRGKAMMLFFTSEG